MYVPVSDSAIAKWWSHTEWSSLGGQEEDMTGKLRDDWAAELGAGGRALQAEEAAQRPSAGRLAQGTERTPVCQWAGGNERTSSEN